MKNRKITIENGLVYIPNEVSMSVAEIADLFDIFYQTAKREIRVIEKSGGVGGDYSMSCIVEGQKIVPEYYGLEMVIAVAFRVQSRNAKVFQKWIIRKVSKVDIPEMLINRLLSLDVSHNTVLTHLLCEVNRELADLNLGNITSLKMLRCYPSE